MLAIRLNPELEKRLARLAKKQGAPRLFMAARLLSSTLTTLRITIWLPTLYATLAAVIPPTK